MGVFTGDTANRHRVPAVGGDVDFDGEVVEPEERDGVGADLGVETQFGEAQNSGVLVTKTEFTSRGDHAVRDVTVGLSGRNGERPGKNRAGKRHDDLVADAEVVSATDDSANGLGAVLRDSNLAPVDGFTVRLRFRRELENLADDDRTGQVAAVNGLFFEADSDERFVQVFRGHRLGEVDPFTQLAGGNTHD